MMYSRLESCAIVSSAWLIVEMEIMAVNLPATSPTTSTLPPSPSVEDSGFPLSSLDSEDYVFVEARHPNKVLEGLNSLRLNNAFCDVTLCCGGQEFPCHRIVLASFSSYFQVMTKQSGCLVGLVDRNSRKCQSTFSKKYALLHTFDHVYGSVSICH